MSLNIIVLAKQVPDTRNVGPDAMTPEGTVNRSALPAIFNPEDLNALEQALRLKDANPGSTVTVITMGPPRAAEVIQKLGMPDVILGGRQAIDGDTAQVGPQVAQKLGLPQVTYVEEILKCADGKMTVKRHIDGGVETVEAPLPLVLTVNGSAAPCRPRNAKLVMKYKRAMVPMEKPAEGLAYAEEYEKKPYLTLGQLSTADVDADLKQCGLSGSPTKVKAVQNIVFKAKESKVLTASDADVEGLIQELLANHTIG